MDTKLLELCDIILCSSLTSSMLVLSTSWSLFSCCIFTNLSNVTQNGRAKWFSLLMLQRPEWCLVTVEKCKLYSGSLLIAIATDDSYKNIIEVFHQKVWYNIDNIR